MEGKKYSPPHNAKFCRRQIVEDQNLIMNVGMKIGEVILKIYRIPRS